MGEGAIAKLIRPTIKPVESANRATAYIRVAGSCVDRYQHIYRQKSTQPAAIGCFGEYDPWLAFARLFVAINKGFDGVIETILKWDLCLPA